jgi:hypothetical protein
MKIQLSSSSIPEMHEMQLMHVNQNTKPCIQYVRRAESLQKSLTGRSVKNGACLVDLINAEIRSCS